MLAVACALGVVAVVSGLARHAIASPILARLRVLVPAWRFFDRATTPPSLLVRIAAAGGALGAWQPISALATPEPRWRGWAFAPAGNLGLAYQAAVEQLVAELGELALDAAEPADATDADAGETDPAVLGLVSYALVGRIARAHAPAGATLQWKIVVPGEPAAAGPVDYLISPVLAP